MSATAASLDEQLATPPPAPPRPPKSPPLAFAPTSNDALAPLISPPPRSNGDMSPAASAERRPSPPLPKSDDQDLQAIVDVQANTIQLLHEAFAAERQSWNLEKERLYQRIASLEKLLKTGNGYSPAKSPVTSPTLSNLCSPQSRATAMLQRLSSIPEDDGIKPLSLKREGAPIRIEIPGSDESTNAQRRRSQGGSVSFGNLTHGEPTPVKVEEIPVSPPQTAHRLSPPPPEYREHAGHTPISAPRPPTPPPKNTGNMDGIEDTPTRNNTHINSLLTQSTDEEEDIELKGPLNMPELPHMPDATNFTMDMLSLKLKQIEQHPERNKPLVFAAKSPGLASPPGEFAEGVSPGQAGRLTDGAIAPSTTRQTGFSFSNTASDAPSATSPNGAPLSQVESRESQIQQDFEQGGIRLKKKSSTNFGAPFGVLSPNFGIRKNSDLDSING